MLNLIAAFVSFSTIS